MELVIGFLLPWGLLAIFGLRPQHVTHPRFYAGPVLVGVLAAIAVFLTEAGPTPDFWVGLSASLAAIMAAGLVLVVQSFLPLDWWVRGERPAPPDA